MKHKATRTIQHTQDSGSASSASRSDLPTGLPAPEPPSLNELCRFSFRDGRTCRLPLPAPPSKIKTPLAPRAGAPPAQAPLGDGTSASDGPAGDSADDEAEAS